MLYDQPNDESLCQKIESVQYNAALAITGAIKSKSQIKLYNELGLESLKFSRWFRKRRLLFKIIKHGLPEYLFNLIPQSNHQLLNSCGYYNILLQNRRFQIFLFSSNQNGMEQT